MFYGLSRIQISAWNVFAAADWRPHMNKLNGARSDALSEEPAMRSINNFSVQNWIKKSCCVFFQFLICCAFFLSFLAVTTFTVSLCRRRRLHLIISFLIFLIEHPTSSSTLHYMCYCSWHMLNATSATQSHPFASLSHSLTLFVIVRVHSPFPFCSRSSHVDALVRVRFSRGSNENPQSSHLSTTCWF